MHGLGPHQITVNNQPTTVRDALGVAYSAIEEAKADISALWAMHFLATYVVYRLLPLLTVIADKLTHLSLQLRTCKARTSRLLLQVSDLCGLVLKRLTLKVKQCYLICLLKRVLFLSLRYNFTCCCYNNTDHHR